MDASKHVILSKRTYPYSICPLGSKVPSPVKDRPMLGLPMHVRAAHLTRKGHPHLPTIYIPQVFGIAGQVWAGSEAWGHCSHRVDTPFLLKKRWSHQHCSSIVFQFLPEWTPHRLMSHLSGENVDGSFIFPLPPRYISGILSQYL